MNPHPHPHPHSHSPTNEHAHSLAPHDPSRRRFVRDLLGAGAALVAMPLAPSAAAARDAALHLLCSGPAGSVPDIVARTVGEQLTLARGSRAWIDNRPGAGGQLSAVALKNALADGSTLLLAQGAIATVLPDLYPKLGYDAALDLRPVSLASEMALGLAVGPAVPVDVVTLDDFVAWAGRHPNDANIGSPGIGTVPHLLAVMLFQGGSARFQHVAYNGGPPAISALIGGQIAGLVLPDGLLRQHHAAGRIRVIATSGATRSSPLPEVRTFSEQGRPDLQMTEWFAFFAPGATPAPVVGALSAELREALAQPALVAAFAQSGMTAASSSPQALSARIEAEQRIWRQLIRRHDIRAA